MQHVNTPTGERAVMKKTPASTKAAKKTKKVKLPLHIGSEGSSLPAPAAAEKLDTLSGALARHLSKKYGPTKVEVSRQKTLPIDPFTILVLVGLYVGDHVAGALLEEMTKDAYQWIKKKLSGTRVVPAEKKPKKKSK
jgi:hypothetical protein